MELSVTQWYKVPPFAASIFTLFLHRMNRKATTHALRKTEDRQTANKCKKVPRVHTKKCFQLYIVNWQYEVPCFQIIIIIISLMSVLPHLHGLDGSPISHSCKQRDPAHPRASCHLPHTPFQFSYPYLFTPDWNCHVSTSGHALRSSCSNHLNLPRRTMSDKLTIPSLSLISSPAFCSNYTNLCWMLKKKRAQ